jgi:lipoprotein NlpD
MRKPKGIYHTVRRSETLWRICKTYHADIQDVAELNNIRSVSQIKTGDRIFIPGAKKTKRVLQYPKNNQKTHKLKKAKIPGAKKHKRIIRHTGMFQWPVRGKIIKKFGVSNGIKHDGINIKAPSGTPVMASSSGRVVFSSFLNGYGNTIIIQHKNKYATVYANNKKNLVKKGNWVKCGQKIALVGRSSKKSSIPHLHFQTRKKNKAKNPLFYLPK